MVAFSLNKKVISLANMKNTIKISIPEPCAQKWDEMQPDNNGRFCSSCEKTVVDFTKMDDEGFVAYFQNIKNIPCGRLTERQLSLDIPFKSKPLLPFGKMSKYIAASMITVAALGGKVFGQNPIVIQTSPNKDEIKKEPSDKTVESELIRGRIIDKDNNGIAEAYIVIESLDLKTATTNIKDKGHGYAMTFIFYIYQIINLLLQLHLQPVSSDIL
jgi:hypothetical protein